MRLVSLLLWDIRFQLKYGFYFLYVVLTLIYTLVIIAVPESFREKTAAILIYSDPASMGLFFMGAIVLLEKSQHTPCAFAVSPVRAVEYMLAKAGSLSAISLAVAAILALAADVEHLHIVLTGTVISSVVFTLTGIIIATKIISLNQFILWTVPIELVCFAPAILYLFSSTPSWLRYYPFNVCMEMVSGRVPSGIGILNVIALIVILSVLTKKSILKMWTRTGGVKL